MAYNQQQKLRDNIEAIRLTLEHQGNEELNFQQTRILSKYSGFGGLKAIYYPNGTRQDWLEAGASESDMKLYEPMMELHELLLAQAPGSYGIILDSLRNSTLSAFYTPAIIPETIYSVMRDSGIIPQTLYDPSAGAGIFMTTAEDQLPGISKMTGIEKDFMTGRILSLLKSSWYVDTRIEIKGLEETGTDGDNEYDMVVSNIPFGDYRVYDREIEEGYLKQNIHCYFFTKGLSKLREGGIMAYLTTDAFLNTPSNEPNREYLFGRADFVSLTVMPDNLMKDSANTEAPTHLLIVQKNSAKVGLSTAELELCQTVRTSNSFGSYTVNRYVDMHPELFVGNEKGEGTNQYGKAKTLYWQNGSIEELEATLGRQLREDLSLRLDKELYHKQELSQELVAAAPQRKFTILAMPESAASSVTVQLGLFESFSPEHVSRSQAYLVPNDDKLVIPGTARFFGVVKTTDHPDHEAVVLLAAKHRKAKRYIYRLYSNVREISVKHRWLNYEEAAREISQLSEKLKEFDHKFLYEGDPEVERSLNLNAPLANEYTALKGYHQEGSLVEHLGLIGTIDHVDHGVGNAIFQGWSKQENGVFYQRYIQLRDEFYDYRELQDKGIADEGMRMRLNETYDAFVADFKQLNTTANQKLLQRDEIHGNLISSSLERREGKVFVKSDLLIGSVLRDEDLFRTSVPIEALARTLNDKGRVDLQHMSQMTDLPETRLVDELLGHILLNPSSGYWETRDNYLSGNVYQKMLSAQAKHSEFPEDNFILRSLEEIQGVQPEAIPFELLDFNLGERWIPAEYYSRFASEFFQTKVDVHYFKSNDLYKIEAGFSAKLYMGFAVTTKTGRTMRGDKLLEYALENTNPTFTYEVDDPNEPGKKKRLTDNEATQLAHQRIEEIRDNFEQWLQALPDMEKQVLTDTYNQTFNCYVLRKYDGSHLRFPELDRDGLGIKDLYPSQKDAAWRIIQNRGALIDHEVGLGKTLTMIIASQEMKRLGIAQKPMIIALKANVMAIANDFRLAYPGKRLLAPGKEDFTVKKRQRILHEIKNNNWDCIILTHDQFGMIPQSNEIMRSIITTELEMLEADLHTVKDLGGDISKSMLKGLEIRRNNTKIKLQEVEDAIAKRKDDGIDFNTMGIDHLFVDESHKFKNLTFTTRHDRVAGLGNTAGSQKALNLLFAVRSLQEKFDADLCVTFLSGTPISNSLTELYLIFKYLRPRELERQGIPNFDAWAAIFARKSQDFEFSVTNEIISKQRFRNFIKIPELQLFYNEITDYRTADHIGLDRPKVNERLMDLEPTPAQREFTQSLLAFAKTGNAGYIGRAALSSKEDAGRMLIATNYAKKMAVDMRLINPVLYDDHPENKVNTCAKEVYERYLRTNEFKGTQIIFSDIGTPKADEFNIYDAMKIKLVELGIPDEQISYIHEWSDAKKPKLFELMNNGEIRVLLGSTEKAGTGLNVQARMVGMHQLDIPWRPSDFIQRIGRGARQGNWLVRDHYGNVIENLIYATRQSLDGYKFNLLKNKQTYINEMKSGRLNQRRLDEGGGDEENGLNYAEYLAVLSGDTSLLEKSKLEQKIRSLDNLRTAHFMQLHRTKQELARSEQTLSTARRLHGEIGIDLELLQSRLQRNKEGSKINALELRNFPETDQEKIGKYLINLSKGWRADIQSEQKGKIGELYGFELIIHRMKNDWDGNYKNHFYAQREGGMVKYQVNDGMINTDSPNAAARFFLSGLEKMEALIEKYSNDIQHYENTIPALREEIEKPFSLDQQLKELREEHRKLEKEINNRISAEEAIQAPVNAPIETFDNIGIVDLHSLPVNPDAMAQSPSVAAVEDTSRPNRTKLRFNK